MGDADAAVDLQPLLDGDDAARYTDYLHLQPGQIMSTDFAVGQASCLSPPNVGQASCLPEEIRIPPQVTPAHFTADQPSIPRRFSGCGLAADRGPVTGTLAARTGTSLCVVKRGCVAWEPRDVS